MLCPTWHSLGKEKTSVSDLDSLNPDPDAAQSGYGYRNFAESGSNPDPDEVLYDTEIYFLFLQKTSKQYDFLIPYKRQSGSRGSLQPNKDLFEQETS